MATINSQTHKGKQKLCIIDFAEVLWQWSVQETKPQRLTVDRQGIWEGIPSLRLKAKGQEEGVSR